MKFLRVGFKFLVEKVVDGTGRIRDAELRDVDEEFAFQGATTDKNRKIVAAAIGESVTDTNFLALDDGGESDEITDGFVAGGVANIADFEIIDGNLFASIERTFGGKKRKFKMIIRSETDVASPN